MNDRLGYDEMLHNAAESMVEDNFPDDESDEFEFPDYTDPAVMLNQLDAEGAEAGSDLNDGEDVMGYFGWRVDKRILTITYTRNDDNPTEVVKRWKLVAIEEHPEGISG